MADVPDSADAAVRAHVVRTPGAFTTILNGIGAPPFGLGAAGDFYIDRRSHSIYGPKTARGWGKPTSLIGPPGAAGSPGSPGSQGAQGAAGAPGATGEDEPDTLTSAVVEASHAAQNQVPVANGEGGYQWAQLDGGVSPFFAVVMPSGDSTGETDTANINKALSSAAAGNGGTVKLLAGTFQLNDEIVMPNTQSPVTLEGDGRNATVLRWPNDLGSGKYAIRGSQIDGGGVFNRLRHVGLIGPGPGTYASPSGRMLGLGLAGNAQAYDVDAQYFAVGCQVYQGNQDYTLCTFTNNYDNVQLYAVNANTGDISFTDVDLTGAVRSSLRISGTGPSANTQNNGVDLKRVHMGFATTAIWVDAGSGNAGDQYVPGFNDFDFIECVWEACGNAIIYCPETSVPSGEQLPQISNITFIDCNGSAVGSSRYYQSSMSPMPDAAVWCPTMSMAHVRCVGNDTFDYLPTEPAYNALLHVAGMTNVDLGECVNTISTCLSSGIPLSIGSSAPSNCRATSTGAAVSVFGAEQAVGLYQNVGMGLYGQVAPYDGTGSSPLVGFAASSVTSSQVASNGSLFVVTGGRARAKVAVPVAQGQTLVPYGATGASPGQPTALVPSSVVGSLDIMGWVTDPISSAGETIIYVRPQRAPSAGRDGSIFTVAAKSHGNPLAQSAIDAATGWGNLVLYPLNAGGDGYTIDQLVILAKAWAAPGAKYRMGVFILADQERPFTYKSNATWANLIAEVSSTVDLVSASGPQAVGFASAPVIPPSTWFAVGGVEQGSGSSGSRVVGTSSSPGSPLGAAGFASSPYWGSGTASAPAPSPAIALAMSGVTGTLAASASSFTPNLGGVNFDPGVGIIGSSGI